MLYLIVLKLLFNDDKVRSIEVLIIDGVPHKRRNSQSNLTTCEWREKRLFSMEIITGLSIDVFHGQLFIMVFRLRALPFDA